MGALSASCVWRVADALVVALDARFGEPHDAYVNGSQVWLREDGPGGVVIEYRLHPVASYERPPGLTTYAVFPTIALALSEGNAAPVPVAALWDGLEAFAAYDDELEPAALAACATRALGVVPDQVGLVDHDAIGDEWERTQGAASAFGLLVAQLSQPAGTGAADGAEDDADAG